jgi:hypothetical protein
MTANGAGAFDAAASAQPGQDVPGEAEEREAWFAAEELAGMTDKVARASSDLDAAEAALAAAEARNEAAQAALETLGKEN